MNVEGEGDCVVVNKGEVDASNLGDGALLGSSKAKGVKNKDFMRADKIDFKSWDLQLEKHLSKVWSKDKEAPSTKKEEWEIDLAKLHIRNVIAHGTYGTVYKGAYDGQDVAVFGWQSYICRSCKTQIGTSPKTESRAKTFWS